MIKIAHRSKRLNRSVSGNIAILLLLFVMASFMALPLIYIIANAFKPLDELFRFPPLFYPIHPTLNNFKQVYFLTQNLWVPLSRYVFNSILISLIGTASYVVVASMAAYPLAKHHFPGSEVISAIIVSAILFRPEVTGIPRYLILSKLGFVNTYWVMLLPVLAGSMGVFLMKQFMVAFPTETIEAARIDGCGTVRIWWSIVMPSVKPGWITLSIFTFQGLWGETGGSFIYDESLKTLPAVLQQVATGANIARAGAASAVALLLIIPPIVFFVISQSSVIETMSYSGMK